MRPLQTTAGNSWNVRHALLIGAVTAAYVGSGKLGLDLAFATSSVTAIWPPTGIALAALVLGGYRLWPAVTLGALLTNLDTGVPAVTVLGITTGNTLEALAGAYLLRRVGFRPTLARMRDVLALAGCGAVLSTMVSATIGVASLLIGSEIDVGDAPSTWRTWWLGDMGGDLIVAPALLVLASHRPLTRVAGRPLEAAALTLALGAVSVLVFSSRTTLLYVVFPLLVWAALRFWQPGAALASLLVAGIAVAFTASGEGPFAASGPDERLLLAQTFVAVAGMTALVLAAVTSERHRAEQAMREIAGTLQESLLPTRLPTVPNLDVQTYFRPAGRDHQVGGDFFDLFEAGNAGWAFVVGDVCGKGPRAAALTALARYTVREAAEHEQRPSRVLRLLHAAVRRQSTDLEFCTAVYARLDVAASTARVTLCVGGHPLPLMLDQDGGVRSLGEAGTLLGAYPEPELADHAVELRPGETILFYTDGLLDAFAPEHSVTVTELESILASCAGLDPAGILAQVDESLLAAPDGAEPRDDVAIVVMQVSAGA